MDLAQYRKWTERRIAHLNHALRGLPEDRIRFHTCYGVNFGPRVSDLQLDDVLDLIFTIKAGAYSFEAANPRHDHEWRVLGADEAARRQDPDPGRGHAFERDDRASRARRRPHGALGEGAGRENVMFGNDCGFSSTAGNTEIPATVAWAKLKALGDGAKLAAKR